MLSANPETISTELSLRKSYKELGSIADRQIAKGHPEL